MPIQRAADKQSLNITDVCPKVHWCLTQTSLMFDQKVSDGYFVASF